MGRGFYAFLKTTSASLRGMNLQFMLLGKNFYYKLCVELHTFLFLVLA